MMRSELVPEQLFKGYEEKLQHTYRRLKEVMPSYFFRSVSENDLKNILPLATDLWFKSGVQTMERDDSIAMVYFKSPTCNPIQNARGFLAGKRILQAMVHESKPLNERGDVAVIECALKELPGVECAPHFTEAELRAKYQELFGAVPPEFADTVSRIAWCYVADLDLERLVRRLPLVMKAQNQDYSIVELEKLEKRQLRLTVAVPAKITMAPENYYARILMQLELAGFRVERSYLRDFTRGAAPENFAAKAVRVNSFYMVPTRRGADSPEALRKLEREINELAWSPAFDLFEQELLGRPGFDCASINLMRGAAEFVHSQLAFVDRNAYTLAEIRRFMATYPDILHTLAAAFESRFMPGAAHAEKSGNHTFQRAETMIAQINSGMSDKDHKVKVVLGAVADFLKRVLRSNYFSEHKAALAFCVAPAFMNYYEALAESYGQAFPPERPFGVFFFWRRDVSGFHLRFSEIARGGWRTVVPRPAGSLLEVQDNFEMVRGELFRECFVLAHTQHRKNKDIYEGGAKLVTLLELAPGADFKTELWNAQRAVFDAFLSLIRYDQDGKPADPNIVDCSGRMDIIEIGPDENMFDDMIGWMAQRAAESGYILGSGIISGKLDTGINHKHYGVTSFGVHQYLLRTLRYLGIDPATDEFTVKLSGGPAGDVAGNEIKLLNARDAEGKYLIPGVKIVAVTDGPAAAYDPAGLDREELSRLVHCLNLDSFDPAKLKGEGACIIYNRPDPVSGLHPVVRMHQGSLQHSTMTRDEFMRHFQDNICHEADVFIPCGGRPQTLNADNCMRFVPGGKPSSRAIVEGANSFLSPAARNILQQQGIVIVKDASANKCGVITSSYEILSGLLLSPEEWNEVHGQLVPQVLDRLAACARREAEWLFREFEHTGRRMTDLSDELAQQLNQCKREIAELLVAQPELLTDALILEHLPPIFRERYADRMSRIPLPYRQAIAAAEIASRLVFRHQPSVREEIEKIQCHGTTAKASHKSKAAK